MASQTTYYNLIKPATSDPADIADINSNSDTIDTALNSLNTQKANGKVLVTATLTTSSYGVYATAVSGYSLNDVYADMVAVGYRVTSGSMSSLTSDITVTTARSGSAGTVSVSCTSAPTASVTLEIVLI